MDMMNVVRLNAYAKLNLTLDVTGQENGFHMLDSAVVTVDLFDRVVLKRRKDTLCSVVMHGMGSEGIPPEENNALRAAEAFVSAFQTNGADIVIYKNIPIGGGLGGSSADAAGVLLGMKRLYGVPDMGGANSLADRLGSDTKYLLTGGLARMRGRGDRLEFSDAEPEMHFLVLCPARGVSAGDCYAEFDRQGSVFSPVTEKAFALFAKNDIAGAARYCSNHLSEAAKALEPCVGTALSDARSFSPLGASMTGSGSAAFALFETGELAAWAKSRYRGKDRALVLKSVYPRSIKSKKNPYALSEGEGEGE